MNLGSLLTGLSYAIPLAAGAALYAIGHIRGSKAASAAAPRITAIETKLESVAGVASAGLALATNHEGAMPLIQQGIGAATATAASALNTLTSSTLPPAVAQAASAIGDAALEKVRQGAENIASQTLANLNESMKDINLSGSFKVGQLATATAKQPAPPLAPGGAVLP